MGKVFIVGDSLVMQNEALFMAIESKFGRDGNKSVDTDYIAPTLVRELINGDEPRIAEIENLVLDPAYVGFADAVRISHSCGIHVDNSNTEFFATCVWIYQDGKLEQL